MTDVDVQPVRRKGRYGLDRGVVVLAAIAVAIGVAVVKPWSGDPSTSPISAVAGNDAQQATAALPPDARPTQRGGSGAATERPAAPTERPTHAKSTISLVEARLRAADAVTYDVFSALLATASDSDRVKFRDAVPRVTEFGYCDSGALFETPVEEVALITATVPVTSHEVVRLFETGDPIPVPVRSRETAPDGFVVGAAADGEGLPIGHYAVIMRAYGAVRIVPFCVAEVVRLANGALARFVPHEASQGAAREALLRDLANIRSE